MKTNEFLQRCNAISLSMLQELPYAAWNERLLHDLRPARYRHTLQVVRSALVLAEIYGADRRQALIAALLHDNAKNRVQQYYAMFAGDPSLPDDLMRWEPVAHAFLGAISARRIYGVTDDAVCEAIRVHATGKPGMTVLEDVVFVADAVEPTRTYAGVERVRKALEQGLDQAVVASLEGTLQFLRSRNQMAFPLSQQTLEDKRQKMNRRKNIG